MKKLEKDDDNHIFSNRLPSGGGGVGHKELEKNHLKISKKFNSVSISIKAVDCSSLKSFVDKIVEQILKINNIHDNCPQDNININIYVVNEGFCVLINTNRYNFTTNDIYDTIGNINQSNMNINFKNLAALITITYKILGHSPNNLIDCKIPRYFLKKHDPNYRSCFFDSVAYILLKYRDKKNIHPQDRLYI